MAYVRERLKRLGYAKKKEFTETIFVQTKVVDIVEIADWMGEY